MNHLKRIPMYKEINVKDLLDMYDSFIKVNRDILFRKGNDYSGDQDRLRNFKLSSCVKVLPEKGILVRIMDKISRITELLEHSSMVKDEKIDDTVSDLHNYVFLLYAILKSRENI